MKVKKQRVSPRQKMINLMYVLLMAMLALNVSSDVLNGFTLVDESLSKSSINSGRQNETLYEDFESFMAQNKLWHVLLVFLLNAGLSVAVFAVTFRKEERK